MQDRPDLIQSELAGLAFDSLQQVFRKSDIAIAMALKPLPLPDNPFVFVVIDPAAGGPQSDYAVVSIVRERGNVTVRPAAPPPAPPRHLTPPATRPHSAPRSRSRRTPPS